MSPRALMSLAALSVAGCGGDDDEAPAPQAVEISFQAVSGGEAASCASALSALGTEASEARLQDLRFYVSEVTLLTADGGEVPVSLDTDTPWQNDTVALIDLEDASERCAEAGTADMNHSLVGAAPEGAYDGVRFTLGVPAEMNHLDSAAAPAPLNLGSMYWSWQTGYKFFRADFQNAAGEGWFVHLGSTMCDRDEETGDTACRRGNRPTITLRGFDPLTTPITVDIDGLLAESNIDVNTPDSPPGCMSNPMEPEDCGAIFQSLGMTFDTGACVDGCGGQRVFRAGE